MKSLAKTTLYILSILLVSTSAFGIEVDQYASTVIDYSSTSAQWAWDQGNTSYTGYTAEQALGAPNTFLYGDYNTTWAPLPNDGTLEYISLGFAFPVYADGVTVRETYGNGFVYQIDLLDSDGIWHTVWAGVDPTPHVSLTDEINEAPHVIPQDTLFSFTETTYLATGVKIYVDTSLTMGRWEEIDAVTLHGNDPDPFGPPVAANDSYDITQDLTLTVDAASGVLSNDTDGDNDPLVALLISDPNYGTLTLSPDGSFIYEPQAGFTGTDTFDYKASTGLYESEVATVTINVLERDTQYETNQYASTVLDYSSSRVEYYWDLGYTASTVYMAEQALGSPNVFEYGTNPLAWAPYSLDGTLEYISLGFETPVYANGVTVREISGNGFVYEIEVQDTAGNWDTVWVGTDPTPIVTFTDEVNQASHVVPQDAVFAFPETTYLVTGVRIHVDTSTRLGRFEQIDAVSLRGIAGSLGAPPVAVDDTFTISEEEILVVDDPGLGVLSNDTDPDNDPLTALLVSEPANGTLSMLSDGTFSYTPDTNFNGIDSFTYKASDGIFESAAATVRIDVTPVGDVPVAVDDAYSALENTMLIVDAPGVLDNDTDPDNDALEAVLVSPAANGTVTLNADGSLSYSPDLNFIGTDSFTYRANDGLSESNVAMVSITVTAVNDPPVAVQDEYSTAEDTPLVVAAPGVLGNDSDVDGPSLSAILVDPPEDGMVTLNADGSFSYSPDLNFNGIDTFTYVASDGESNSDVSMVIITVTTVDDVPVAVIDMYTTVEDTPLVIAAPGVLANDNDVDGQSLSAILVDSPENGTVSLNADGSFSYSPDTAFIGDDSFTYKVSDGFFESEAATVWVSVTAKTVSQYASSVLDYSSTHAEWAWERGIATYTGYMAERALGSPDVFEYGASPLAWAPYPRDDTLEYISLGFETPVYANGVTVREISGNGFVYEIEVQDMDGNWNSVWAGTDPTPRVTYTDEVNEEPWVIVQDASFTFPETTYLVTGVRIHVDTSTRLGRYEQVDAVMLHGILTP